MYWDVVVHQNTDYGVVYHLYSSSSRRCLSLIAIMSLQPVRSFVCSNSVALLPHQVDRLLVVFTGVLLIFISSSVYISINQTTTPFGILSPLHI